MTSEQDSEIYGAEIPEKACWICPGAAENGAERAAWPDVRGSAPSNRLHPIFAKELDTHDLQLFPGEISFR